MLFFVVVSTEIAGIEGERKRPAAQFQWVRGRSGTRCIPEGSLMRRTTPPSGGAFAPGRAWGWPRRSAQGRSRYHLSSIVHHRRRSAVLVPRGYRVIRFNHADALNSLDGPLGRRWRSFILMTHPPTGFAGTPLPVERRRMRRPKGQGFVGGGACPEKPVCRPSWPDRLKMRAAQISRSHNQVRRPPGGASGHRAMPIVNHVDKLQQMPWICETGPRRGVW